MQCCPCPLCWVQNDQHDADPQTISQAEPFSTRLMLELRNISRCGRTLPAVLAERKGENLLKKRKPGNLFKQDMDAFFLRLPSYGKKWEEFLKFCTTWRITFLGLEFPQSWKRQGVDIDSGSNNGSSSTSSSTSASSSANEKLAPKTFSEWWRIHRSQPVFDATAPMSNSFCRTCDSLTI